MRPRLRELGISIGQHPTGPNNAITDVPGVAVGHTTIIGDAQRVARNGVTVVLPRTGEHSTAAQPSTCRPAEYQPPSRVRAVRPEDRTYSGGPHILGRSPGEADGDYGRARVATAPMTKTTGGWTSSASTLPRTPVTTR